MTERAATYERTSKETRIELGLNLDGCGKTAIKTGFGILDHMLELLAFWAGMDLSLTCAGDLHVDAHHTVEDTGLALGAALLRALGDRTGIERAGHGRVPMDEALADVTLDISGRPWLVWLGAELLPPVIAREEKDVWREFYKALAASAKMNVHIRFLYGENGHHLLESAAKGFGVALARAAAPRRQGIRSTKGLLD